MSSAKIRVAAFLSLAFAILVASLEEIRITLYESSYFPLLSTIVSHFGFFISGAGVMLLLYLLWKRGDFPKVSGFGFVLAGVFLSFVTGILGSSAVGLLPPPFSVYHGSTDLYFVNALLLTAVSLYVLSDLESFAGQSITESDQSNVRMERWIVAAGILSAVFIFWTWSTLDLENSSRYGILAALNMLILALPASFLLLLEIRHQSWKVVFERSGFLIRSEKVVESLSKVDTLVVYADIPRTAAVDDPLLKDILHRKNGLTKVFLSSLSREELHPDVDLSAFDSVRTALEEDECKSVLSRMAKPVYFFGWNQDLESIEGVIAISCRADGSKVGTTQSDLTLLRPSVAQLTNARSIASDLLTRSHRQDLFLRWIPIVGVAIACGLLFPFTGWLISPLLTLLISSIGLAVAIFQPGPRQRLEEAL